MYRVNDTVLYIPHGVFTVADITQKTLNGKPVRYYELRPVDQAKFTIFVPIDNEALTKRMRRVLSAAEIRALIRAMPGEEPLLIEDENERKERYKEILIGGDPKALVRLIKAMYAEREARRQSGKRMLSTDERVFQEAERILYEEFAFSLQISQEQVLPFILSELEAAQRARAASSQA